MNQFIIMYKHNKSIIAWYCNEENATSRRNFLTDGNDFGVYPVSVNLSTKINITKSNKILEVDHSTVKPNEKYAIVSEYNNSVINIFSTVDDAIKNNPHLLSLESFNLYHLTFSVGKEIKRKNQDN